MTAVIQAIRGMNDILPEQTPYWQLLETTCRDVLSSYGYGEIRFPIMERTPLFQRTIGQGTDVVEKEMYTFDDRNGESVTLRPEGTACCLRAGLEHGLLQQVQRLWYMGPMFRYERPQKGRYRQFHQFGVEAFGMAGPEIDAEHLLINAEIWRRLGLSDHLQLQINNLGTAESRQHYRKQLVAYFQENSHILDEDSQRRLGINPLRILDSKNPAMQELIENAPKLLHTIEGSDREYFEKLLSLLDAAKISYAINPRLVRGLDYYGLTVYEWVTQELGAQGTVSAGGRYDTLVEQMGGKPTPAVGFALGLERLVLLLEKINSGLSIFPAASHIYCVFVGEKALQQGLVIAEKLRRDLPNFVVTTNLTQGNFKSQFKKADKSGAQWAVIIGEDELTTNKISVKNLRKADQAQEQKTYEDLIVFLGAYEQALKNNQ